MNKKVTLSVQKMSWRILRALEIFFCGSILIKGAMKIEDTENKLVKCIGSIEWILPIWGRFVYPPILIYRGCIKMSYIDLYIKDV